MKPFDVEQLSLFGVTVGMTFAFGWLLAKWRYGRLSAECKELRATSARNWNARSQLVKALQVYIQRELELLDDDSNEALDDRNRNVAELMNVVKRIQREVP